MTSAQLPLSLSHAQRSHIQANTGCFSPPLALSWVTETVGGVIRGQECDISNLEICEEKREGEREKKESDGDEGRRRKSWGDR